MLNFYKSLIALRRERPALLSGLLEDVTAKGEVLRYTRRHGDNILQIALNLGDAPQPIDMDEGLILLSTDPRRQLGSIDDDIVLAADEGIVVEAPSVVPVR